MGMCPSKCRCNRSGALWRGPGASASGYVRKNLTFKTGGVDGCDCEEILKLIEDGKIDTTPLITHRYSLADIAEAYDLFENRKDNVIKTAVFTDNI